MRDKWLVTLSGSHVLVDVGLVIRQRDGCWRVYTVEDVGDFSMGPYKTLEEAQDALEEVARRFASEETRET